MSSENTAQQAPKLTLDDIKAVIVGEHYFTADYGIAGALSHTGKLDHSHFYGPSKGGMDRVTFCVLELRNGAKVTGVNHGPVSAANFDPLVGREYARANAIEKVWELEGYLLRERLAQPQDSDAAKAAQVLEIVLDFFHSVEDRAINLDPPYAAFMDRLALAIGWEIDENPDADDAEVKP